MTAMRSGGIVTDADGYHMCPTGVALRRDARESYRMARADLRRARTYMLSAKRERANGDACTAEQYDELVLGALVSALRTRDRARRLRVAAKGGPLT
jgi:hypothetical protein